MKKIVSQNYELKYNYYVNEKGDIFSEKTQKILSTHLDKDGYVKVRLICNDGRHTFSVHRIVLENFSPVDNMMNLQVNHKDGNKTNNNLSNLEWCTCQENIKHAYLNDLRHSQKGENNNATVLTEENVKEIINLLLKKEKTQKEIGKIFNVSEDVVGAIKNKHNWTYLTKNIIFN